MTDNALREKYLFRDYDKKDIECLLYCCLPIDSLIGDLEFIVVIFKIINLNIPYSVKYKI